MTIGDQIFVIRSYRGIPFQHHGIDCGNGFVIHYAGDFGQEKPHQVIQESYNNFAKGGLIQTVEYPPNQIILFSNEIVVKRAESRLGEQQYHLFRNNCEHLATWCKTGQSLCKQANLYQVTANLLVSGLFSEKNWIRTSFISRNQMTQSWINQNPVSSSFHKK